MSLYMLFLALILSCANAAACDGTSTYTLVTAFSASQAYTIGQGSSDITLPTYTGSGSCTDASITYTLTKGDGSAIPSYATFDSTYTAPKVTINTDDTSLTS